MAVKQGKHEMAKHVGNQDSCCKRRQHRANQNNGNQNELLGRRFSWVPLWAGVFAAIIVADISSATIIQM
jgi:hypothetical protein